MTDWDDKTRHDNKEAGEDGQSSGGSRGIPPVGLDKQYEVAWHHIIHQNDYCRHMLTFLTTMTMASLGAVAWMSTRADSTNAPTLSTLLGWLLLAETLIGGMVVLVVVKAWDVRDRFWEASMILAGSAAPYGTDVLSLALGTLKEERGLLIMKHLKEEKVSGYSVAIGILSFEAAVLCSGGVYLLANSAFWAFSTLAGAAILCLSMGAAYRKRLRDLWPKDDLRTARRNYSLYGTFEEPSLTKARE